MGQGRSLLILGSINARSRSKVTKTLFFDFRPYCNCMDRYQDLCFIIVYRYVRDITWVGHLTFDLNPRSQGSRSKMPKKSLMTSVQCNCLLVLNVVVYHQYRTVNDEFKVIQCILGSIGAFSRSQIMIYYITPLRRKGNTVADGHGATMPLYRGPSSL